MHVGAYIVGRLRIEVQRRRNQGQVGLLISVFLFCSQCLRDTAGKMGSAVKHHLMLNVTMQGGGAITHDEVGCYLSMSVEIQKCK